MSGRKTAGGTEENESLLTVGIALQEQGTGLLLAEMRALVALLPGQDSRLPTDAEVEAQFDNMPV